MYYNNTIYQLPIREFDSRDIAMSVSEVEIVKSTLHEIAAHAHTLGTGLQNVAPPQSVKGSSIQYLKEIAVILESISQKLNEK
jgi:hypothetical protein